jgi:endonuclease/exonuclease/phosphatase family metal-dependent hydrolase
MNIKVISTNIRFENPADNTNNWPFRKDFWAKIIMSKTPDIISTQEGRKPQLMDAEKSLENYSHTYKNRSWIEERMYPCIFVSEAWKVIDSGDRWLSETPDVPASSSFGSMFPRLMTYAHIKNKKSDIEIMVVNCHLDHMNSSTRDSQSKVLLNQIKKLNPTMVPTILTGDFNESPFESVRKNINDSKIVPIDPWFDLHLEEEGTHHKFTGDNHETKRIDWILSSEELSPLKAKILKHNDLGKYPSDHFPIFAHFKFNKKD